MLTLLETSSGALSVNSIGERPRSIKEHLAERTPTLLIFPDDKTDIFAELYLPSAERANAPEEIRSALSYYLFAVRGIPREALAVRVGATTAELPRLEPYREAYKYSSPVRYHTVHQTVTTAGGIECRIATVEADTKARIIMLERDPDPTFLRGLKVIKGLPDCERAIAFKKDERGFSFTATDKFPTLDAAMALAAYLTSIGEVGELRLACGKAEYRIDASKGHKIAYLSFSSRHKQT